MDKKTTNTVITVAAAIIFGCCSLFCCIMGFGTVTGNGTYELNGQSSQLPPTYGYVFLCLSIILIIIPIVIGFFTLRKKPEADTAASNEPLPPTS